MHNRGMVIAGGLSFVWSAVIFALLFTIGAFRNVTSSVQLVADINNALLPLSMIVLGVSLVWYVRKLGEERR